MRTNMPGIGEVGSPGCKENIHQQINLWIIKSVFGEKLLKKFLYRVHKIPVLLLVIFLFPGCFEKEECPAYPTEYMKWMPYNMGQTLTFTDGINAFQLKVDQFEVSKKHKVTKGFDGLYNCPVYAQSDISSSVVYPRINLWSSWGCEDCTTTANMSSVINFSFAVYDMDDGGYSFGFAFKKDNLFINSDYFGSYYKGEILNKYHNGHIEYRRVICLEYDTLFMPLDIYKLYVAESVGIIEYVRKKGNQSVYLKGD
jgi:hypothetical protein